MANDIWIVTAYFNPCHYLTRRYNFDVFAARLKGIKAQLLVVEMALKDHEFELGADHEVIRLRGRGLMWQKERLLNIAIASLPSSCRKVIWLDCDLLFEDDHWLQETSRALDAFAVVQPFSRCVRLQPGQFDLGRESHTEEQRRESFAATFARDQSLAHDAVYTIHGETGFAWAARREFLDACSLYDACLTGSGDHLMAHVFAGTLDSPCISLMIGSGHTYAKHFACWATEADRVIRGSLGHVPGRILHLWHGDQGDRRYRQRNQEFKAFAFDPHRHIRQGENGLWEWAEAPLEMQSWATEMLVSRNEDGDKSRPAGVF